MGNMGIIKTRTISFVGMDDDLSRIFSDALCSHADISKFDSEKSFFTELFETQKVPDLCYIAMDGCNTERVLKLLSSLKSVDVPAICIFGTDSTLALELRCLSYGACDILHLPIDEDGILAKTNFIFQKGFVQALILDGGGGKGSKMAAELDMFVYQTLSALSASIDAKDSYTQGHSSRVALFSSILGKAYGYNRDELNTLHHSALMHDVGKIGIPNSIINKEGKLTDEEYNVIKTHPVIGHQILANITQIPHISDGAYYHHERYNGKGYPTGLSGNDIPEIGRIIAVADAYDAMTSNRSYRGILPQEAARKEIEGGIGTQFDPTFAKIMLEMIDADKDFKMREQD